MNGRTSAAAAVAAPLVMAWNVQYLGSFSCRRITSEALERRMDRTLQLDVPADFVFLSLSLNGVFVSAENRPKEPFLAHSIRKVCCVVGKTETRQVAYVTKRSTEAGTSKKECHIFRTERPQQVEEIKSVLSSAFQRILFVDNSASIPSAGAVATASRASSHSDTTTDSGDRTLSPFDQTLAPDSLTPCETVTPLLDTPRPAYAMLPESPRKRQMSAVVLFQKFFGTPKSAAVATTTVAATPASAHDSMKTPVRRVKDQEDRRRKRPVSAVFGHAVQRITHQAANTLTPKRTTTRPQLPFLRATPSIPEDYVDSPRPTPVKLIQPEPALEFDERLGEFVFPIGDYMDDQLQRLAYFCTNPSREEVFAVLTQMPEGAFILRYSESRRRCLALSVRVPSEPQEEPRIAHYLVIRNQDGFRLKSAQRYFPSLPKLITHYTVFPELLPCRLLFVEWDRALLRGRPRPMSPICLDTYTGRHCSPILELSQSPYKKVPRQCLDAC